MKTETPLPANSPHCEKQWPENLTHDRGIANLVMALSAASVLIRMLNADDNIRNDLETEVSDVQPFNDYYRGGLVNSLIVCIDVAMNNAEALLEKGAP
jgi:hypothetical protein